MTLDVADSALALKLGLPSGMALDECSAELCRKARAWRWTYGRPWVFSKMFAVVSIEEDAVRLEGGAVLRGPGLVQRLSAAKTHSLVIAAISAGIEFDIEIERLWREELVDESFALDAYASGLVEALRTEFGARLREWTRPQSMAVLSHYSPGYHGWALDQQAVLYHLLKDESNTSTFLRSHPLEACMASLAALKALPSGMLAPKKSTLAVFGVTRHPELIRDTGSPETGCSFLSAVDEHSHEPIGTTAAQNSSVGRAWAYAFPQKALERWSRERLRLTRRGDGSIAARFLFEGCTCTDMGKPLALEFDVELSGHAEQRRIRSCSCQPAPQDAGCEAMCAYLENPRTFFESLAARRPLLGQPLDAALSWNPEVNPAGCVCSAAQQDHKWRIVYQTLIFALEELRTRSS